MRMVNGVLLVRRILLIVCCVSILNSFVEAQTVVVPQGKSVMIDGKMHSGEWADAYSYRTPDSVTVYFKQDAQFFYICLQTPEPRFRGLSEMYLSGASGELLSFHTSARLGERTYQNGAWPAWEQWWTNTGWTATFAKPDKVVGENIMPVADEVQEYQILKSKIASPEWRLRIDLQAAIQRQFKRVIIPENSDDHTPGQWLVIKFQ